MSRPQAVESRALPRESLPPDPIRETPAPGYSSSPYGVDPIPSLPATSEPTDPILPETPEAMVTPETAPAPTDPMATPPPESPAFTPPPEPKLFSQSAPPAVLALQTDIESNIKSGSYPDAAGSLERAIRIQPKNPELWHVLAEVRLKQNQPGLAEDLAKKSNLLAKNNAELIRSNWSLIAEARRLKGDTTGVMEALDKARW
ncbi:MAG: tetratricopeptide repeat protein [Methylococcus sp.]